MMIESVVYAVVVNPKKLIPTAVAEVTEAALEFMLTPVITLLLILPFGQNTAVAEVP